MIWDRDINVNLKKRKTGEEFMAESSEQEIKNLIKTKYLEEVDEDEKTNTD